MHRRRFLHLAPGLPLALDACAARRLPADLDAPEPPWPVPADYPQAFRTEGRWILDEAGRPRLLRGVAIPDAVWLAQRQDRQLGFFDRRPFRAAAEWRAELLRISVMPAVWRRHGPAECFRVLDDAVAYARRYGLYIALCFHAIGFPPDGRYGRVEDWQYGRLHETSGEEIYRFWQAAARRYAGNRTIAFYELINEPARVLPNGEFAADDRPEHWLAWRDWAEELVDAIRRVDFRKPIIVGGLQFAYNLAWAPAAPVRRANIVYATHPYAGSDWRFPWREAFLRPAETLPVIATEFGWDDKDHPESAHRGPLPYRQAIFQAFDQARIGWVAWAFSHSFTPALLADSSSFRPSPYGDVVLAALQARAAPLGPARSIFLAGTGPQPAVPKS